MARMENDPVLGELRAIKKLAVLALLKQGITQEQLAAVLGVSQASISRMMPSGIKQEKK